MRVFVTGASGFIGSAVVNELLQQGHRVLGLARSDASAAVLKALGADVHRGAIRDLESLKRGAQQADGIIHTAFNHDFSTFAQNCEDDRLAIEAMGSVLEGTTKPFVITSGTALLSHAPLATEEMKPEESSVPRIASEIGARAVMARGVKASILRLPPSVHGDGDHGFVPMLIALAREKKTSAYVDDGQNVWPAVHRRDAARAFRFALEKGPGGSAFHAVAEPGVPFKAIAQVIGRHLEVPVVSKSGDQAAAHFGWMVHFAAMSNRSSSQKTQEQLSWQPTQAELLTDIETAPSYFKT